MVSIILMAISKGMKTDLLMFCYKNLRNIPTQFQELKYKITSTTVSGLMEEELTCVGKYITHTPSNIYITPLVILQCLSKISPKTPKLVPKGWV